MGYTTTFEGQVRVDPPLGPEEVAYLRKFNETRRMRTSNGPYYVDNPGMFGQDHTPDVLDFNEPPAGQPGLWCGWTPTDDGAAIEWDGGEKFYCAAKWMQYLIDHFLRPGAVAPLPFLTKDHVVNGEIMASGEEPGDLWKLVVEGNAVTTRQGRVTY